MQNKIATLPSKLPAPKPSNPAHYWRSDNWRRWELTINFKTKLYLTDEEKEYFVEQLKLGKKIIQVGDMILTKHFDCLVPLSEKYRPLEPGEVRVY